MSKDIVFIYPSNFKPVTGGHIYERNLINTLNEAKDFHIEVIFQKDKLSILDKIISPIRNLSLCRSMKNKDLVVFNSTKGFYYFLLQLLLRLKGIKTMVIHHHFLYLEFQGLKRIIYGCMERLFLRYATYILTPSPYIADLIKTKIKRVPFLNEIPFENSVETSHKDKVANQLLYVGTIEARKGLIYLLKALVILKNKKIPFTLQVIGKIKDDLYFNELRNIAKVNNLPVFFNGHVSEEDLKRFYMTSEIFVFPSLLEGFGMAINEAMCYGLPVIAFDNSAMPYSINKSNGILVPNKNVDLFAIALSQILLDDKLKIELSAGAKVYVNRLTSMSSFKAKSLNLFNRIG